MKKKHLLLMAVTATFAMSIFLLVGAGMEHATAGNTSPSVTSEVANQLMEDLTSGDYDRVYQQLSRDLQDAVSREAFKETLSSFTEGVDSFIFESKLEVNDVERYVWLDDTRSKGITATLNAPGTVIAFQVLNLTSYPATDHAPTSRTYGFPFRGEWLVYWGGSNEMVNYHYAHEGQRYAVDWLQVRNGNSYEGDPGKNESYYAFGEEVLAPADGTVVAVVNHVPDNVPVGTMNPQQPRGNYVVIRHGEQEYSTLAHFKSGSIEVAQGDQVAKGDFLGLCGNSGNSSEPHLHFHVADRADLTGSKSMPISFDGNPIVIQGHTNAVFRRNLED